MIKIEIDGNWKTISGAVRALNRKIREITNYTGNFFDARWYEGHHNEYGEVFDHAPEMYAINVCLDGDGVYNYAYAAVPEGL